MYRSDAEPSECGEEGLGSRAQERVSASGRQFQGPGRAALQGAVLQCPGQFCGCLWGDQVTEADTVLLSGQSGRAWQTFGVPWLGARL